MEILRTLGIGTTLLFFRHQHANISYRTMRVQGYSSYTPLFLIALLFSGLIFYGFESAADVSEEVINPRRHVPRAMVTALLVEEVTTP